MKKHKLFYNVTNITIKMVKFYQNSISCLLNVLSAILVAYRWIYDVGFRGGVRLRHVPLRLIINEAILLSTLFNLSAFQTILAAILPDYSS